MDPSWAATKAVLKAGLWALRLAVMRADSTDSTMAVNWGASRADLTADWMDQRWAVSRAETRASLWAGRKERS